MQTITKKFNTKYTKQAADRMTDTENKLIN
jgi:hypothetical protein